MPYHVTVDVISLDRDPGKRLSNNGKWCLVHEMGKMLPPSPQAAPQWAPGPLLGSHTGLRGQTGTICLSSCMLLPQKYLTNHSSSKSKKKKLNRFWNIECHPSSFSLTWVFLHFLSLLSSSNSRLAQTIYPFLLPPPPRHCQGCLFILSWYFPFCQPPPRPGCGTRLSRE